MLIASFIRAEITDDQICQDFNFRPYGKFNWTISPSWLGARVLGAGSIRVSNVGRGLVETGCLTDLHYRSQLARKGLCNASTTQAQGHGNRYDTIDDTASFTQARSRDETS